MAFINIELDYAEILSGFTKFIINYGVRRYICYRVCIDFSTVFLFSHKKCGLFCDFPKVNKHINKNRVECTNTTNHCALKLTYNFFSNMFLESTVEK